MQKPFLPPHASPSPHHYQPQEQVWWGQLYNRAVTLQAILASTTVLVSYFCCKPNTGDKWRRLTRHDYLEQAIKRGWKAATKPQTMCPFTRRSWKFSCSVNINHLRSGQSLKWYSRRKHWKAWSCLHKYFLPTLKTNWTSFSCCF